MMVTDIIFALALHWGWRQAHPLHFYTLISAADTMDGRQEEQ